MKDFLSKNKVLIIGLLSAIALPVYDLIKNGETSTKVLVMSAAVALTSYLSRNLRGQWQTIAATFGTMLATYMTQEAGEQPISWAQIIGQGIILFLAAASAPAKSIGYEKTPVIVAAKEEGEKIAPTPSMPTTSKAES